MKNILFITLLLNFQLIMAQPQAIRNREFTAKFVTSAPAIDGFDKDEVWDQVEWTGNFIQYSPYENAPPTQNTLFKIIYDASNLYFLVRAFDTEPFRIDKRITKRDIQEGDLISLQVDSYRDYLTSFVFCVSSSNVKTDKIFINDGKIENLTWDPIWFVKTSIDSQGWVAEFKIPLSQLRFNKYRDQEWGLQVVRVEFRNQETSVWQFIPRDAAGWVHNYGILNGLKNVNPKRQIEIAPYIVSKLETMKPEQDNPFNKTKNYSIYGGLDGKMGITHDLTLDFTINPDFGQVENDPSEANLTTWETYFDEKRPFFIEGRNLFDFNTGYDDNLFYSRRIGRAPQGTAEKADFTDAPQNTSIIGAFKLTGKTRSGVSVGVIESFTNEAIAHTLTGETRQNLVVEPITNYFVSRLQKDYGNGNTRIGAMFTSTNRDRNNADELLLHSAAYTAGIDLNHNWNNKTWHANLRLIGSMVEGSDQTITQTQLSPLRYYQRPDAPYVHLDTTLTALTGHGGMIGIGKTGNGHWNFETMLNWHSPGLETNDAGYLQTTDEVGHTAGLVYNQYKPNRLFRSFNVGLNHLLIFNYGLIFVYETTTLTSNFVLNNFWNISSVTEINGDFYSNSTLRGGPVIKLPGDISQHIAVTSDPKKMFSASLGLLSSCGYNHATNKVKTHFLLTFRPTNAIDIGISHDFIKSRNEMQYVATEQFNRVNRYLFGTVNQLTHRFSARMNYHITPELSIQYYVQPFISSVDYSDYKLVTDPRADKYIDRFHLYKPDEINYSDTDSRYVVDENSDGMQDYSFRKPDFKSLDLISNMVIRWEYRPGSSIFLVWSQNRKEHTEYYPASLGQNVLDLTEIFPVNIFLIKFSYRIY